MKSMDAGHEGNTGSNIMSAILFSFAWTMEYFRQMTVSDALSTLLQCLSILSVSLLIVINFPKAMKVLFPKRHKKKEDEHKH